MNVKCKICKKEFYASGDRYVEPYCSPKCYAKKKKRVKKRISLVKLKQESQAIKKRKRSVMCQKCKKKPATQTHHIVYRSEVPRHKNLHDPRNLIDLCYEHHEWYHKKKSRREHLIKERKLWELFPKKLQQYNPNNKQHERNTI